MTARDTLLAAVDSAVIDQIGTSRTPLPQGSRCTSRTSPREYDARYEQQPTAQFWRPFLTSFYDAQAQVVLQHATSDSPPRRCHDRARRRRTATTISAPVTSNFTGTVELLAALPAADGTLNYFETDSGVVEDGSATAALPATLTTISDGIDSAVPFTRYILEGDGWHGYSQFTLQRSDGSIANLNWDRSEQDTGPFTLVDPTASSSPTRRRPAISRTRS